MDSLLFGSPDVLENPMIFPIAGIAFAGTSLEKILVTQELSLGNVHTDLVASS